MTDLELQNIIQQMLIDLGDESNHYMLMANYYEHTSTEKANERWYIANIYIHKNAVANVFFDEESISLGVRLNPDNLHQIEEIKIPFGQIYQIRKNKIGGIFDDEDNIYVELSKFNLPTFN